MKLSRKEFHNNSLISGTLSFVLVLLSEIYLINFALILKNIFFIYKLSTKTKPYSIKIYPIRHRYLIFKVSFQGKA